MVLVDIFNRFDIEYKNNKKIIVKIIKTLNMGFRWEVYDTTMSMARPIRKGYEGTVQNAKTTVQVCLRQLYR